MDKNAYFLQRMEAGDLIFLDLPEEAIVIFGFTQIGITTSCHILANSAMRAQEQNGTLIYIHAGETFKDAKIGRQNNSETDIPNIFETHIIDNENNETKVTLIDQPGYNSTHGFHRILLNGYFHYMTFNKIPKLKFIIAFQITNLYDSGQCFAKTILNFINNFINYDQIQSQILNSTSFLITKVDPKCSLNIIQNLMKIRINNGFINRIKGEKKLWYQHIILHMIKNSKIFMIKSPKQAGELKITNNILAQIYAKTIFWKREIQNDDVNMQNVKMSIRQTILNKLNIIQDDEPFKQEYIQLINYISQRTQNTIYQLKKLFRNMFKFLTGDDVQKIHKCSLLETMKDLSKNYYRYEIRYKDKRKIRQINLMKFSEQRMDKIQPLIKQLQNQKKIDSFYFIRKFQVLQSVIQYALKFQSPTGYRILRTAQQLKKISLFVRYILKEMNLFLQQQPNFQIITKQFTYIIQRIFEQFNIISLLMWNKNYYFYQQFQKINCQMRVKCYDIWGNFQDIVHASILQFSIQQLKCQTCINVDISTFSIVNKQIIDFFTSSPLDHITIKKTIDLLILYSQRLVNKDDIASDQQKKDIAWNMLIYYTNTHKYIIQFSKQNEKNKQCILYAWQLASALGKILANLNQFDLSLSVWKSLHNIDMVIKTYEQILANILNEPLQQKTILMEFCQYALTMHQIQSVKKCFQWAFSKATTFQNIKTISQIIVRIQCKSDAMKEKERSQIPSQNKTYYNQLPIEVISKIKLFCQTN